VQETAERGLLTIIFFARYYGDKIKEDEFFDGTLGMHTEFLLQSVKGNEGEDIVC
jgi:hypothetical protein